MKDFRLTPPLVRAARALLDWQQADLAFHAGLSLTAIKNFEGGKHSQERTRRALFQAFDSVGIEFPASGGVRQREDLSVIYRVSGPDFIQKMNEDIYAAVRLPESEILTASASELLWPEGPSKIYRDWHARLKIDSKILLAEGQRSLNLAREAYRILPQPMMGKITYIIYADRIGFILWKKKQVLILRDAQITGLFKNQFLYLWRLARKM